MIEVLSTTYVKENCVCYEKKLDENHPTLGVKIYPNEGYILKHDTGEIDEQGNPIYNYVSGFVTLAIGRIAITFPTYEAMLLTDVPEGEFISGLTDPTETI